MAHDFCWIELTSKDADAAKSFYSELFGWSYEEMPMQNGGIYSMFQPTDGGPGGGIMALPMPECPTAWMPYVGVDDLDAAVARVRDLGGVVHVEPTSVPGHGFFAMIADPSGATIGLWKNA
jgi:predicted enzyme related to lactoylglutathione lyase